MVPPSSPPCSSPTTRRCCCFVVLVVGATLAFVLACILVAHLFITSTAPHHTTQRPCHHAHTHRCHAAHCPHHHQHQQPPCCFCGVDCGWWQCNGVGCHHVMACTHTTPHHRAAQCCAHHKHAQPHPIAQPTVHTTVPPAGHQHGVVVCRGHANTTTPRVLTCCCCCCC